MEHFHKRLRLMAEATPALAEKRLVFGEGRSFRPDVMLIGEAPGEQESLQGRPFVGKAGKNLDGFLQVLQLQREDIYISNVVKMINSLKAWRKSDNALKSALAKKQQQ